MSEMDDDQLDRQVIARMRSALDELTAGVDDEPLETLRPTVATPRRRGAWWGVAAATVLLAGAAVWALSTRSDDPVASPDETAAEPPTSAPAVPTTTSAASVGQGAPTFTLTSARLVPGRVESNGADPGTGPLFVSWRIEGDGMDGFLFASSYDELDIPNAQSVEPLDPPVGDAQLVWPTVAEDEVAVPWIRWVRPEGGVWAISSQGLYSAVSSNDWIDLVFEAVPGSGLPIVIPDERATFLAFGTPSTTVITQAFTSIDAGTVDLTVTDGGASLFALIGATDVRAVTVAGADGWLGTYADGHVEVVWDATGGWWGLLGISPELADQADDIVASVTRVDDTPPASTVAIPSAEQRYEVVGSAVEIADGQFVIEVPTPDQSVLRLGLSGFTWTSADIEHSSVDGFERSEPGVFTVRDYADGSASFVSVQVPAAFGDPRDPCVFDQDVLPFDQLNALDQRALDIAGYEASLNADGTCDRIVLFVYVDSPELRAAIAPFADALEVRPLLTPV